MGIEILGSVIGEEVEGYGELGATVRDATIVRATKPTQLQRLTLGIGVTSLLTLTQAVVTVTPQVPFRIERFISPSTGLVISDIKVGTNSQFVGSGSVPVEVFAADAVGVAMRGDTAVPGVDIAIYVSNPTAGTLTLSGAYLGSAAV